MPSTAQPSCSQPELYKWKLHNVDASALGETEEGCLAQRRISIVLCQLRDLPDLGIENTNVGLDILSILRRLALEENLAAKEEKKRPEGAIVRVFPHTPPSISPITNFAIASHSALT